MEVPVLPGPRGWRRQRHPAPAAPPPLSVSAPKKRNNSATITPRASSSGAPNRNEKNLLFGAPLLLALGDRKSTRLNSSHLVISYAVFCLKKKKKHTETSKH